MNFIIEKENLLQHLRIVEKAALQNKSTMPVLSNILFETLDNQSLKLTATDNDIAIFSIVEVDVLKPGKFTLSAKLIMEIVSKLPNKKIEFLLNEDNSKVSIICEKTKYSLSGIDANEFPKVVDVEELKSIKPIEMEITPFIKGIKNTSFAAAGFETKNIISGVYCSFEQNNLEMVATDGNRLTRYIDKELKKEIEEKTIFVVPSRAMNEILRISSLVDDKDIFIYATETKIVFKTSTTMLVSKLLIGNFPAYQQAIPQSCSKNVIVGKDDLINALERVSVMVDDKMNIVKFSFNENKMMLKTNLPNEGESEDEIDIEYDDEEITIAFNYKYVIESLKNMETKNIKIGMNNNLTATLFIPEEKDNYLCLIMPIQIR